MKQIEFTEEEMKALNHERYHHPHPSVQRKMKVLWLKAHGLAHDEITQLADVSPNTIRSYFRRIFPIIRGNCLNHHVTLLWTGYCVKGRNDSFFRMFWTGHAGRYRL